MNDLFYLFLDDKPYNCTECGRRYKRKIHLSAHIRYECGKTPLFTCTNCGKRFHQKSNLRSHIQRIHYNGNQFKQLNSFSDIPTNDDSSKTFTYAGGR